MARRLNRRRSVEIQQSRQRWLHKLARKEKKAIVRASLLEQSPGYKKRFIRGYQSTPLRLMADRCTEVLPADAVAAGRMTAPAIFSLHHNPQETLRALFRVAKYAKIPRSRLRISIDLAKVEKMDLAADSLLAILLKEIKNECFNIKHAVIRGTFPRSIELRREMEEVGTVKVLKSDPGQDNVELSFSHDVKVFRHRQSGIEISRTFDAAETVETITEKFSDHVNGCLKTIRYELNEIGRKNLCTYVGELLTNAQEHAGITDWTIIGYLDTESRIFKVAVINFGKSIEDTFAELPDGYALDQVKPYVERHELLARKKFGMTKATLITVAALQGKVSSKNKDKAGTRGQGTIAMVEFFQRIYDQCSGVGGVATEMALISGETYISFNGDYRIRSDSRTKREVIAFNRDNDLQQLPDGKVVRSMPGVSFPGTIITISFPLTENMQIREVET